MDPLLGCGQDYITHPVWVQSSHDEITVHSKFDNTLYVTLMYMYNGHLGQPNSGCNKEVANSNTGPTHAMETLGSINLAVL